MAIGFAVKAPSLSRSARSMAGVSVYCVPRITIVPLGNLPSLLVTAASEASSLASAGRNSTSAAIFMPSF
jgi:hypothetical protein